MTKTETVDKTCTGCGTECPATLEFFVPDKRATDGLQSRCRQCTRRTERAYRQTEQGKAYWKAHYQTDGYKARKRVNDERYHRTINGYLHGIFAGMKQRCTSPKSNRYHRYGGRGIKVKFESSDQFVQYVTNTLKVDPRGLQVDRINNDGHYEPGNIRFVTCRENCNNKGRYD